jgi:hypothetical protein
MDYYGPQSSNLLGTKVLNLMRAILKFGPFSTFYVHLFSLNITDLSSKRVRARQKWNFQRTEAECTHGYMSMGSAEKSNLQTNLSHFEGKLESIFCADKHYSC